MFDIGDLMTAIKGKIDDTSALSQIHGKFYWGLGLQGVIPSRPHARGSLIGGNPQQAYGGSSVDKVLVTFAVFANTLATANSLAKAISQTFAGQTLDLNDQKSVHAVRRGCRVLIEGTDAKTLVYRSEVDIEAWVSS